MDGYAQFGRLEGRSPVEVVDLADTPEALDRGGVWFVVAEFDGRARAWRFADVRRGPVGSVAAAATPRARTAWAGPARDGWTSSLDQDGYEAAVRTVREHVRAGDVYQVNVCRVLSAPLAPGGPDGTPAEPDARALAQRLAAGNPAPYQGVLHVPASSGIDPVWVVCASPELFLRLDARPAGITTLTSGPIKGTATSPEGLGDKDRAENVMITDLVRNDLQRVCAPGTVEVTSLLGVEHHPGLVHLVSTVTGRLRPDVVTGPGTWARVLAATFPPASVSGAPKSSALRIIRDLEPVPRGPYCGAVGWVDADAGTAELAVGIRTFWWDRGTDGRSPALRFGTGAGITWGSDPHGEWLETELKARRLVDLASAAH
ncbi:chorismate-binding protein [Sanguibacter suaedae]|uniref:Chorismate-binding protein n=1 Tax=Sanguibacter suaedae TaxID=2795737 RepID=A0A934IE60_9MICO|nr:chorismate-binding protein [Sanguibacter suaedae]MBI9115299.1 chorismate-binding protein [Sanguibacter suaedae]